MGHTEALDTWFVRGRKRFLHGDVDKVERGDQLCERFGRCDATEETRDERGIFSHAVRLASPVIQCEGQPACPGRFLSDRFDLHGSRHTRFLVSHHTHHRPALLRAWRSAVWSVPGRHHTAKEE